MQKYALIQYTNDDGTVGYDLYFDDEVVSNALNDINVKAVTVEAAQLKDLFGQCSPYQEGDLT